MAWRPMTLSIIFTALADPTRRSILARLAQGAATVKELAELFQLSLPGVSKLVAGRVAPPSQALPPIYQPGANPIDLRRKYSFDVSISLLLVRRIY